MTDVRSALRVAGRTVEELAVDVNRILERLLGQDRRRYNVEPSRKPLVTVTANYAASDGDYLVRVDATAGAVTVTLPPAAAMKGLPLWVKKVDTGGNTVTVDADGAELIDGAATLATSTPYATLRVVSNGTSWDTF